MTLSAGEIDEERRAAIDAAVTRGGGTATWRTSPGAARSYALLELPDGFERSAVATGFDGTLYDGPIIALALFPAVAEALPALREALTGRGRPAGILASYACTGGVVVEWDPLVTKSPVVFGLVDVELRRFNSGRTAELLTPLPTEIVAAVAAAGLQAPQIEPRRILELGIERA